jgi:hypothetical protein
MAAAVGTRSLSASPGPDSNNNGNGVVEEQLMNAGGEQSSGQGETVAPARKRIQRACDKCSSSRTKCDGKHPWSVTLTLTLTSSSSSALPCLCLAVYLADVVCLAALAANTARVS